MSTAPTLSLARTRASAPPNHILTEAEVASPRTFPFAAQRPRLPIAIRDEILELYAFIFCQHGFHQMGMTFEQFLMVIATIKPDYVDDMFHRSAI
jgi:hypothetical protein